jgi:hypothetical protein
MLRALSKSHQGIFSANRKNLFSTIQNRPHMLCSEIQKRTPTMGISMNSRTSGFRKWSEAHDPKIIGARAVEAAVISAPELDPPVKTPEKLPHGPWLVPGAGTL